MCAVNRSVADLRAGSGSTPSLRLPMAKARAPAIGSAPRSTLRRVGASADCSRPGRPAGGTGFFMTVETCYTSFNPTQINCSGSPSTQMNFIAPKGSLRSQRNLGTISGMAGGSKLHGENRILPIPSRRIVGTVRNRRCRHARMRRLASTSSRHATARRRARLPTRNSNSQKTTWNETPGGHGLKNDNPRRAATFRERSSR